MLMDHNGEQETKGSKEEKEERQMERWRERGGERGESQMEKGVRRSKRSQEGEETHRSWLILN